MQVISRKQYVCNGILAKMIPKLFLCNELTLSKDEQIFLFCDTTIEMGNVLCVWLLKRFGLRLHASFINNTALRQLDMLFSGCYGIFENESDRNCSGPRNYLFSILIWGFKNARVHFATSNILDET